MHRKSTLAVLFILSGNLAAAGPQSMPAPTRGELLYATHCVACHSTQVHWREKKLVTDWTSLQAEVRRWQKASGLGWSNEDVAEVARYLNALHYHFPTPESHAGLQPMHGRGAAPMPMGRQAPLSTLPDDVL